MTGQELLLVLVALWTVGALGVWRGYALARSAAERDLAETLRGVRFADGTERDGRVLVWGDYTGTEIRVDGPVGS